MVRVFTDGACSKNGKKNAKASYAFWIPEHPSLSSADVVPLNDPQTNNRGELMAIQKAVDCISLNFPANETDVHIYTDSMYSKNCLTIWIPGWMSRGWKTSDNKDVSNRDLIEDIVSKLTKFKSYTITHVRAHTGKDDDLSKNNAIVDRMAVEVMDPSLKQSDTKVIVTQNTTRLLEDCPVQLMGPPVSERTLLDWCYTNLQKLDKSLLDSALLTVLQKTAKKSGFNLEKQKVHKTSVYRLTSSNHLIAEGKSIVKEEMSVTAYHFWSPTCAPCKVIKPAVEDLKEEFEGVTWISVNTHDDPNNYATKFNVSVVPTIVVVNKNGGIEKHSGTAMMGYYRILRSALKA